MNIGVVIDIILTVIVIAMGAYSTYISCGKDIYSKVAFLIREAAKLDLIGSEKMKIVVDKLHSYIPITLQSIFTKDKLESMAQSVYDEMKAFAKIDSQK